MDRSLKLTEAEIALLKELQSEGPVSWSYLRMENKIVNSQSRYVFPVLSVGGELTTERKLDKNDSFVATRIGMFLYERDSATKDEGKGLLQTYVNANAFTANAGFTPAHLNTIYNGSLEFKKGVSVIADAIDTDNFLEVSEVQKSGATNESSKYRDSGYIELVPQIKIPGREAFVITANFPTFNGIAWQGAAANKDVMLVLKFRGFLIKGASR